MGYYKGYCFSALAGVLALAACACASIEDNTLDSGERIVLVSSLSAPPKESEISTVRARQFPILVFLANLNRPEFAREQQAKSLERASQTKPIHVQTLEDQEPNPSENRTILNRQRRHLKKQYGGGGCNTCGGGYQPQPVYYQPQPVYYQPQPVHYQQQPVYQKPTKVIVVNVVKGKQHGGGGGYRGGGHGHQSGCGGGCGGGGYSGGSQATATATATASAYSSSYGKK